ncbi:MAG: hypothetical protein AB7P20_20395 [Rhizobiaceae bacterium]
MTAVNTAAAERGQILASSRSVNAKVQTLSHYTDHPEFSTFSPLGNHVAEIVLASICKARNVSPPVGRVLMAAHRMGGLSL